MGLIFTWVLTLFGVFSSIVSPFYGFLVYVSLALIRPESMWIGSVSGRFSLIVALAMIVSWALRGFGNWNLGKARLITYLFVGFWMWSAFLATMAPSQPDAWYFVEQIGKILLPFLVGITTAKTERDLKLLAWTIVLCQGAVALEMNLSYFRGYNRLYFGEFGGLDNNGNGVAFVAALGVMFFLFLNTESWIGKGVSGFFMALTLHAILFSFSRGAMLSTVIGVTISFFLIKKKPAHYAMFGAGLLAAIVLAGPEVQARFLKTFAQKRGGYEESAQIRLDMWGDCWTVIKREPILGVGPDHWPLVARGEFGWTNVAEAHSTWIQTAVELGFPGAMLLIGFYGVTVWRCWVLLRTIPPNAPPWFGDACRITIAAICGFGVAAQFITLEAVEIPYYIVLLGAATLSVYAQQPTEEWERELELQKIKEKARLDDLNAGSDWRDHPERTETHGNVHAEEEASLGILN